MKVRCVSSSQFKISSVEALALGVQEDEKKIKDAGILSKSTRDKVEAFLDRSGYKPRKGEIIPFDCDGLPSQRLYVAVLSKEFNLESVRQIAARLHDVMNANQHSKAAFVTDSFLRPGQLRITDVVMAMAEAIDLGHYRYQRFKPEDENRGVEEYELLVSGKSFEPSLHDALKKARLISQCVNFTRELVNTPANELPPRTLADRASAMAKECGLSCRVMKKKDIQKLKMGGVLAVNQGSAEEPRFIVLEHGNKNTPADYVFVGKGVCFDSGGISIKPSDGMEKMKYDMAGGAAVIGLMRAVAMLKIKKHIVGLVPAVENMPSGTAQRPGDVIWMASGKSVEVLNTDAEGRLILADALYYAKQFRAKAVVDLATLTGAVVVALGTAAMGVLGNDQKLIDRILKSGEKTGERAWQLPLWDEYYEQIKGDVGEIKNIGGKGAGTITAAMFLKQFVDYPWVHLDIAGTAWVDEKRPYFVKGATGSGVRLLVEMIESE